MDTCRSKHAFLALTLSAAVLAACGGDTPEAEAAVEEGMPLAGDPPLSEAASGFDQLDADGSSELDTNEFHQWAEGPYVTVYGPVASEALSPGSETPIGPLDAEVLIDGLYAFWDQNDDGMIDQVEWARATSAVTSLTDSTDAWMTFDMDGNETVDLVEVRTLIKSDIVVDAMDSDQDGNITDVEMNEWFFALFDVDESGTLSRSEWRMAEQYLGVPTL